MNRPLRECANPGNHFEKQSQGGPNESSRAHLNCYRSHLRCQVEIVNVTKLLLMGGFGGTSPNCQGRGDSQALCCHLLAVDQLDEHVERARTNFLEVLNNGR